MNNLSKVRLLRGLTQYELGASVGLSQARIWRIEQGYEKSPYEMKQKFADLLQVEFADLFSESEEDLEIRYDKLEKERDRVLTAEILRHWEKVLNYRINNC